MDIQKAREKFAEINLKEGFYTEEELSITDLGVFEYTAAEQDWEKWWECLIYYVEPMLKAQAVPEGFVLVSKTPGLKTLDRLFAEHDIDEERAAYIYRDIIDAQEPAND